MKFYIPPAGLPVSLDCEFSTAMLYDGSRPEQDGQGVIWSGKSFHVPVSVAIVDICGRVLYDVYVQPHYKPTLWLDNIHGITERKPRPLFKIGSVVLLI